MKATFQNLKHGYTIVELMTTMAIVTILAATVGTFFVKLLNIQETDREAGYVREKLTDICGAYADMLSVGSSISIGTNGEITVNYRHETGGVSLETGIVTRVSHATMITNNYGMLDLGVYAFKTGGIDLKLARSISGDARIMALTGDIIGCRIIPLRYNFDNTVITNGYETTDAALGYLVVTARYKTKADDEYKTVKAGRVVRMWNRE